MKFRKSVAVALAGLLSLGVLAGCSNNSGDTTPNTGNETEGTQNGNDSDTVKIGIIAPLTGGVSVYGVAASNGAIMAIEDLNANGGILGREVEFLIEDDKGDISEAKSIYSRMMESNIHAIVGAVTSKPTAAVAMDAALEGIPMITPSGTALDITTYGENVFRACFTDPYQGKSMAIFSKDSLGLSNAAILYDSTDDYSIGLAEAFEEQFLADGGNIIGKESYAQGDIDFKSQLTTLNNPELEVLFIPCYYNDVRLITAQAREIGMEAVFVGADGWDGTLSDIQDASVVENSYYCNHYSPDDPNEDIQKFISDYTNKYGEPPISFALLGYDSVMIIAEAMEKAGSTDFSAVVDQMQQTDMPLLTGNITFDEDRNPVKTVSIIQIKDGQDVLFTKLNIDQDASSNTDEDAE